MDVLRLKQMAMDMWRRGGPDTLVKVLPLGTMPDPLKPVGYCTTLKPYYSVELTPQQIATRAITGTERRP